MEHFIRTSGEIKRFFLLDTW